MSVIGPVQSHYHEGSPVGIKEVNLRDVADAYSIFIDHYTLLNKFTTSVLLLVCEEN